MTQAMTDGLDDVIELNVGGDRDAAGVWNRWEWKTTKVGRVRVMI